MNGDVKSVVSFVYPKMRKDQSVSRLPNSFFFTNELVENAEKICHTESIQRKVILFF